MKTTEQTMAQHARKVREYNVTPVPAPRMTRRDKWLSPRRPCVEQYFAFRDEIKRLGVDVKNGDSITFVLQMPSSWSAKKKARHDEQPHQQRPDLDNLVKALLDSVYGEDCHIWHISELKKIWGVSGWIFIEGKA